MVSWLYIKWNKIRELILSYEIASGSEITPCNKIDKPLAVYGFFGKVMTSIMNNIVAYMYNDKPITFLRQKWDFKVI